MRCTFLLLPLLLIGCQTQNQPHDSSGRWVELARWMDNLGNSHNDKRSVSDAEEINRLQSFFPDLKTAQTSNLRGPWQALLMVKFHNSDGTQTTVYTDYHLYRVNDGQRGDFIVKEGFADEIDRIFAAPPPTPS